MSMMHLVSVNVGQPREIEHAGKRVRTGIFKQAVSGPVRVDRSNLEGDAQADPDHHGGGDKAVYAFALEQYDHWQAALGREPMAYGQFGENLTIAGLDESDACIGDRWRIGEVELVVTQPRIPCSKLGIRMQQPDMPKRFTAHGWPGIYLRVEQAGTLAAGDAVEVVGRAADSVTVRELFQAFSNPRAPGAAAILGCAIAVPALADTLRVQIRRRLGLD